MACKAYFEDTYFEYLSPLLGLQLNLGPEMLHDNVVLIPYC